MALILKEISFLANYEFLANKFVLPLDATWLVTVADEGKELSRLLVRSVSDFSSILEEMAFSKKSFDAIFSLTEAAAWWWCPARAGLLLLTVTVALTTDHYLLSPTLALSRVSQDLKQQQHSHCPLKIILTHHTAIVLVSQSLSHLKAEKGMNTGTY